MPKRIKDSLSWKQAIFVIVNSIDDADQQARLSRAGGMMHGTLDLVIASEREHMDCRFDQLTMLTSPMPLAQDGSTDPTAANKHHTHENG